MSAGDGGASRDVELLLAGLFNALQIAAVSNLLVEGVAKGMVEKVGVRPSTSFRITSQ